MLKEPEFENFQFNYQNKISHYRNALGHKKSAENYIELTKGKNIPIDEVLHQKMRENLTRYNTLIEKIEKFVKNDLTELVNN